MSLAQTLRELADLPEDELRARLAAIADAIEGKTPAPPPRKSRPRRKRLARTDRAHIEKLAREKGVQLES